MGKIINFSEKKLENLVSGFEKFIEERNANPEFQKIVAHRRALLVEEMKKRQYKENIINEYIDNSIEDKDDNYLWVWALIDDVDNSIDDIANELEPFLRNYVLGYK